MNFLKPRQHTLLSMYEMLEHPFCIVVCKDELYGDFEDLETGEVHVGKPGEPNAAEVCSDPSHLTCAVLWS